VVTLNGIMAIYYALFHQIRQLWGHLFTAVVCKNSSKERAVCKLYLILISEDNFQRQHRT